MKVFLSSNFKRQSLTHNIKKFNLSNFINSKNFSEKNQINQLDNIKFLNELDLTTLKELIEVKTHQEPIDIRKQILNAKKIFNQKYHLKDHKAKVSRPGYVYSDAKEFKEKYYYDSDINSSPAVSEMIDSLYITNFKISPNSNLLTKLQTYVENCYNYGQTQFLSGKHFMDKKTRNLICDTDYQESLDKMSSPYNLQQERILESNLQFMKSQASKRDYEKYSETIEDKVAQAKNLNFLAETNFMQHIKKIQNIHKHNTEMLENYENDNEHNEYENKNYENELLNTKLLNSHLGSYLRSRKAEKSKNQSLGLSFIDTNEAEVDYQENKGLYEYYPDLKDVVQYPGSSKGPNPEDDPEYYTAWFMNNQPKQFYNKNQSVDPYEFGMYYTEAKEYESITASEVNLNKATNMTNGIFGMYEYEDDEDLELDILLDGDKYLPGKILTWSTLKEVGEANPLPPKLDPYYETNFLQVAQWNLYSIAPACQKSWNGFFKLRAEVEKNMYLVPDSMKIGSSIMPYYNMLPKWARENDLIKMITNYMEFLKPHNKNRDKQIILNMACNYLMPVDKTLESVFLESLQTQKRNLTLGNVNELLAINIKDSRRGKDCLPDEYFTDEELEFGEVTNASQVRAIEKEEEEERKAKKKEEGRAKRAASEGAADGGKKKENVKKDEKKEGVKKEEEEVEEDEEDEEKKEEVADDDEGKKKKRGSEVADGEEAEVEEEQVLKDEDDEEITDQKKAELERNRKMNEEDFINEIFSEKEIKKLNNYTTFDKMIQENQRDPGSSGSNLDMPGLKDWPAPEVHNHKLPVDRSNINLPIDYFLNDDGFWDDYIETKNSAVETKDFLYKPLINYGSKVSKTIK